MSGVRCCGRCQSVSKGDFCRRGCWYKNAFPHSEGIKGLFAYETVNSKINEVYMTENLSGQSCN